MQRFWLLLKPDQKEITNIYFYAIFNGLVMLSLPLGIQAIINLIQGGLVNTAWIVLVVLVVLGVGISGILSIYQLRLTENLQQKIFTRAAFEFSYRLPKIRMEALYRHYAPELMNRFFDTMAVQKGLSKILIDFSSASLQVLFGLILLSLYHPFFIIFSVVLALLGLTIFRLTAKDGLSTSLLESKSKYKMAHWLEEIARTSSSFKLTGHTDLHLNRTDKHVNEYLNHRESHFKVLVRQFSLLVVFKIIVTAGLLAVGGMLVMQQQMNIGQFIAAELIILLVIASVEKLIVSLETIYDVLTALEKIGQVTDLELEQADGIDLEKECTTGGMTFEMKNLDFTYPGSTKPYLKNISFKATCGNKFMISGLNGSGKSTLLHVAAGLYDTPDGIIKYNDLPKGNLNLDSVRSAIGHYFTEEQIFQGSILENISMGRPNVTFEDVKWAVEHLKLTDFIGDLPDGYATQVEPFGYKLPRGVVQKLLIARSIVHRPKLLLIDDSFDNIDETEYREIIDFLLSAENEWTLLMISSDPYVARKMDSILIMKDGSIVNQGIYEDMQSSITQNFRNHA